VSDSLACTPQGHPPGPPSIIRGTQTMGDIFVTINQGQTNSAPRCDILRKVSKTRSVE